MGRLFEGIRRITATSATPGSSLRSRLQATQPAVPRIGAPYPPPTPIDRMGPARYDPIAHETLAEIANARAPLDFAIPAHALAEIADLRRQLADVTAAAHGRTLSQLTADMPKTEAGLVSELAAVRADRDRLERINDRLRGELAELKAKLAGT